MHSSESKLRLNLEVLNNQSSQKLTVIVPCLAIAVNTLLEDISGKKTPESFKTSLNVLGKIDCLLGIYKSMGMPGVLKLTAEQISSSLKEKKLISETDAFGATTQEIILLLTGIEGVAQELSLQHAGNPELIGKTNNILVLLLSVVFRMFTANRLASIPADMLIARKYAEDGGTQRLDFGKLLFFVCCNAYSALNTGAQLEDDLPPKFHKIVSIIQNLECKNQKIASLIAPKSAAEMSELNREKLNSYTKRLHCINGPLSTDDRASILSLFKRKARAGFVFNANAGTIKKDFFKCLQEINNDANLQPFQKLSLFRVALSLGLLDVQTMPGQKCNYKMRLAGMIKEATVAASKAAEAKEKLKNVPKKMPESRFNYGTILGVGATVTAVSTLFLVDLSPAASTGLLLVLAFGAGWVLSRQQSCRFFAAPRECERSELKNIKQSSSAMDQEIRRGHLQA